MALNCLKHILATFFGVKNPRSDNPPPICHIFFEDFHNIKFNYYFLKGIALKLNAQSMPCHPNIKILSYNFSAFKVLRLTALMLAIIRDILT